MVTWDQLAAADKTGARASESGVPSMANWAILSGVFSINNLKSGAFAQLPTAHINEMLKRFQRVGAKRGQVVIREGDAGDYYYVLEAGKCLVERNVGGVSMKLAELKGGDAFGEEALVANAKRNATVTMLAEGSLFRLAPASPPEGPAGTAKGVGSPGPGRCVVPGRAMTDGRSARCGAGHDRPGACSARPRRAGRHARQARQAAVDVANRALGRRLAALEHLLDQVDAPARAVELVAEQDIGRAGGGTESQ